MPWAMFDRFSFCVLSQDVASVPRSGSADDAVARLLTRPYLRGELERIGPDAIRDELREYGAWDESELADDEANAARIVWLGVADIQEGK